MNYEEIRNIVRDAIDSGRIRFAEKLPVVKPENKTHWPRPDYGQGSCVECTRKFPKLSPTNTRCLKCTNKPRKCAICKAQFINKSRRRKPTQTCSLECAKELGKRTRKASGR